jgi:hypothetical protein
MAALEKELANCGIFIILNGKLFPDERPRGGELH